MNEVVSGLKYSLYVIFHPFDGFWDLKFEKRGNIKSALILLFLLTFTVIFKYPMSAFLYDQYNLQYFNALEEMLNVLGPFFLWCIANWCLTTLMDGEGSFKDIVITSCYALVPIVLGNVVLIICSYFFSLDEATFYNIFQNTALIWAAGLMVFGTMVLHQYTLKKTIITIICIIIGMGIIIFIGLLFFTLLAEIYNFVESIYNEIVFRL